MSFILLLLCCLLLSGCLTVAAHTRKADRATAVFANKVSETLDLAFAEDPKYSGVLASVAEASGELSEIANKDPSRGMGRMAGGALTMIISLLTGGGGIAFGAKMLFNNNNMRGLVKDLANMDKDESREHVIKHKVQI